MTQTFTPTNWIATVAKPLITELFHVVQLHGGKAINCLKNSEFKAISDVSTVLSGIAHSRTSSDLEKEQALKLLDLCERMKA